MLYAYLDNQVDRDDSTVVMKITIWLHLSTIDLRTESLKQLAKTNFEKPETVIVALGSIM